MKTAIIIPARYGSTRFPGKPLAQIAGKTMLARVVEAAAKATQGLNNASIHIATDHEDIAEHARGIGVDCIMTDESCKTGSDRVLQAAQQLGDRPDFVLNLQGDAPFTPPDIIRAIIETAQQNPDYPVITPAHPLRWNDLDRLRENKKSTPFSGTTVTVNAVGRAMWFSKNIIPAIRKEDLLREANDASPFISISGYTDIAWMRWNNSAPCPKACMKSWRGWSNSACWKMISPCISCPPPLKSAISNRG